MSAEFPTWQWEEKLRSERGWRDIAGVDEAGRGSLAGPVVAAGVIFPEGYDQILPGLNDSKKLTAKKRDALYLQITSDSRIRWAIGVVSAEEIDQINILQATWKAMKLAVSQLNLVNPCGCLVDGLPVRGLPVDHEAIVSGDAKSFSIAAASVIAKVSRDRIMIEMDSKDSRYGFSSHKGYGTKSHLDALSQYGLSAWHRKTFSPCNIYTEEDLFGKI